MCISMVVICQTGRNANKFKEVPLLKKNTTYTTSCTPNKFVE